MKSLGSFSFVFLAATVLVVSVSAQMSLSSWPYYVEVTPARRAPGIYDLVVPLPLLDKSGTELSDLRLFDSANREIPYAIRVRKDVNESQEFEARLFNESQLGATSEVTVDLGEDPREHNEVEIETSGTNFRRRVALEGSNTGSDWRLLNSSGMLLNFASQNDAVESKRISYPTSRYRYLRVKVQRDELTDNTAPRITSVKTILAIREKGQLSTWTVPVPSYQLLRNQGAHASAWNLDLGARAPCDRLTLEIDDNSFSRPFQVEAVDDPQNVRLIATGTLSRHVDDPKPLVIIFNEEEHVRKLRLQITDYSNPTLNISSIQASAPARQLLFELKDPVSLPLRLYFGSASVSAPHYDFEKELPIKISAEPIPSTIGDVTANAEYKPEPLPLTERVPWLIYFVLAASSIALGFILLSLARSAMRMKEQPTD
jgi:Protein of unknown function (DUF3999)